MNDKELQLRSIEAFLRRASKTDAPFMIKGSIITRQYLPNREMRHAGDLDCVYLKPIGNDDDAAKFFSSWVREVTETIVRDDVEFRSFSKNDFWRRIDYAMNDDFPTVNTDLLCHVDGVENDWMEVDISFNLDVDFPPEEIEYIPLKGEPFLLKQTCPLCLQISWKLHQLLVRPRLKDMFDLIHLVNHESFDQATMEKTVSALQKECKRDKFDVRRLLWYVDGRLIEYFTLKKSKSYKLLKWDLLESTIPDFQQLTYLNMKSYGEFTTEEYFKYEKLSDVLVDLRASLNNNGFTPKYVAGL